MSITKNLSRVSFLTLVILAALLATYCMKHRDAKVPSKPKSVQKE